MYSRLINNFFYQFFFSWKYNPSPSLLMVSSIPFFQLTCRTGRSVRQWDTFSVAQTSFRFGTFVAAKWMAIWVNFDRIAPVLSRLFQTRSWNLGLLHTKSYFYTMVLSSRSSKSIYGSDVIRPDFFLRKSNDKQNVKFYFMKKVTQGTHRESNVQTSKQ